MWFASKSLCHWQMACTVIFPMMCSVVSQKPYQALLFTGIERTSQIKPIPELHSAPPPITFLPIGQVAVAPGQRSFDAVTLTISISPFPAFFHEPDWHGGQCQSGSWKGNKEKEHFTVYGTSGCGHTVSYAVCPSGSTLVSGGYQLTAWSQDNRNPFNSPDS
ncbi:TPA: hypothetical protein ACWSI4_005421, partial [Escherichia coli]